MARGIFGRVEAELGSREKSPGLSMMDVLDMPEALRDLLQWMMRQEYAFASDAAAHAGKNEAAVRGLIAPLIENGNVVEFELKGKPAFRVRLARKRGRDLPADLWQALNDKIES